MFSKANLVRAARALCLTIFTSTIAIGGDAAAQASPGSNQVATFSDSGTFSVPRGVVSVEVLLVGPGGAGGKGNTNPQANNAGGGGGGMVLLATLSVLPESQISVNLSSLYSTRVTGGGQTLTAAAGSQGSRASSCYAGSGGIGYTGTTRLGGTPGSQTCYGTGGTGGGVATQTDFTGTTLVLGGGGKGGSAGRVGAPGEGSYGYGGGGGTTNGSEGSPGGPGFVAIKWVQPSNLAQFSSFSVPGQLGASVIDDGNRSVLLVLPNASDRQSLTPSFQISPGATVTLAGAPQTSGSNSNDFSAPLSYLITSQDGTDLSWTVTVKLEQLPFVLSSQASPLVAGESVRIERTGGSGSGGESISIQGAHCSAQGDLISASQASSCSVSVTRQGDDTYIPVTSNVVVYSFAGVEPTISPQATVPPSSSTPNPSATAPAVEPAPAPQAPAAPAVEPAPAPQAPAPVTPRVEDETNSASVITESPSTSQPASNSSSATSSESISSSVSGSPAINPAVPVASTREALLKELRIGVVTIKPKKTSATMLWKPVFLSDGKEAKYQYKITAPNSSRWGRWINLGSANSMSLRLLKSKATYRIAIRALEASLAGGARTIQLRLP